MNPPPLPAKPVLPPLADFGDWLSPMIVKELRQGLRTWVFVGAFIVLQAVLVMLLLISSSSGNEASSTILFWSLVAFILVFIMPLRGFNALAGEMKAQTLDILALTRLSGFRIALGKWAALVSQSALIAISVLPFVALRYFGGGVDLIAELRCLLLLGLLSAGVTGIAVAFSALPSIIVRTLLLLGVWWMSLFACIGLIALTMEDTGRRFFGFGPMNDMPWWAIFAVVLPLWAFVCYFLIDLGASVIAPLAANHATRKRLISLGMFLIALGFVLLWPDDDGRRGAFFCLTLIWLLASFDCLTEAPTMAPSVYVPFVRRGAMGKVAASLYTPGWATGLLFFLFISAAWALGCASYDFDSRIRYPDWLYLINAVACPLAPLFLARLFARHSWRPLGPYVVCALCLFIFSMLVLFMEQVSSERDVAYVGVISPPSAFILASNADGDREFNILAIGAGVGLVMLVLLLLEARRVLRDMRAAMTEAETIVALQKADLTKASEAGAD